MTWAKDLKFGQDAEEQFVLKYPGLTRLGGTGSDIIIKATGAKLELKTERRPSTQTGNIFFERYSHKVRQTNGGPFKALDDGSRLFAHWFSSDDTLFLFETAVLVDFLLANFDTFRYHEVRSVKSNAAGLIVPIDRVKHLTISEEVLL
jgi:hypothetical protein